MEEQDLHTVNAPEDEMFEISSDEWNEISKELEGKHALFYQCWQMGRPRFTTEIPTAAIGFDHTGEYIEFVFNPKYWQSLNDYERLFVISHECLHVVLNHGLRATAKEDRLEGEMTNMALDIVVNHMLVNSFGFKRNKIRMWKDLCWVDTVFSDLEKEEREKIPDNHFFEYYYNLIKTHGIDKKYLILDLHNMSPGDWENVIKKLDGILTPEEKEAIKPLIEKHGMDTPGTEKKAGEGRGGWRFVGVEFTRNRKWESIVQNWVKKYIRQEMESKEQWIRLNRRFQLLDPDLFLPTEMEEETEEKVKIPVYMFIDTSGSCYSYRNRFINLAASIPEDRFSVRVFTFDTAVEEVDMKSAKSEGQARMYGWGGTSFRILHDRLQKELKETGDDHPEAIFVLTDGYGDKVSPDKPEKWHWLLTPGHNVGCIPKESHTYNLKNFE